MPVVVARARARIPRFRWIDKSAAAVGARALTVAAAANANAPPSTPKQNKTQTVPTPRNRSSWRWTARSTMCPSRATFTVQVRVTKESSAANHDRRRRHRPLGPRRNKTQLTKTP
jgi:hypothetical protein